MNILFRMVLYGHMKRKIVYNCQRRGLTFSAKSVFLKVVNYPISLVCLEYKFVCADLRF